VSPDKNVDDARVRAGALVGLIDLLGQGVVAEDIERASLVPLTDQAVQAAFNVACALLMNLDCLTAILGGCCPEERIAFFASLVPSALKAPARPRRPRSEIRWGVSASARGDKGLIRGQTSDYLIPPDRPDNS
jgi:hypothetical protein